MTEEVRTTSSTGGQKGTKQARYDLIPSGPLKELAELYGKGAEKYADRNWELGYEWSKSFAALNRHLWQFWNGEDFDAETDKKHMASVAFHAFALMQFMEQHPEFDDRPLKAILGADYGTIDNTEFDLEAWLNDENEQVLQTIETPVEYHMKQFRASDIIPHVEELSEFGGRVSAYTGRCITKCCLALTPIDSEVWAQTAAERNPEYIYFFVEDTNG